MEHEKEQNLNSIVQSSTMLLTFEGWIKYIEGFSRGLQTTKSVDSAQVFDCIAEIMEYMKTLKNQLVELLVHCEQVLEEQDVCNEKINNLQQEITELINNNKQLLEENTLIKKEKEELKAAVEKLLQNKKENTDGNQ